MANHSVSASQLTESAVILIRGSLSYSRLCHPIDGAELQTSDARRVQNGGSPIGKPYTTATITQAVVVPKDQANLTIEEQFVAERRYSSKKHPDSGLNYSIDSKGQTLPIIAIPSDTAGQVVQDDSGQELASGLDVTLVMRVYKVSGYSNRGLSLDQVIVNEPVRYYTPNTNTDELAARGIVFAVPPQPVTVRQGRGNDQSAQPPAAPPEGTVIDENGLAFPAPAGAPAQQTQPVQAPAAQPAQTAPHQASHVQAQSAQHPAAVPPTAVAPATVPAAPAAPQEESLQARLDRLTAENESLKNAGSAIGAPAAPAGPDNPWDDSPASQQAGITPGR